MSDRLPEEQINELLPCLKSMAELISIGKHIDRKVLTQIIPQSGLYGDDWIFSELGIWATILSKCLDKTHTKDSVLSELRGRGIPEFPAVLAYDAAKPKPMIIEPKSVDFGCLKMDDGANTTLQVSGEPIVEVIAGKHFKVMLKPTDSDKTLVKLQLLKGTPGESIREEVIFRGNSGEVKAIIAARWESAPARLSWCPKCGDSIKKKSLFFNPSKKSYECLNLMCRCEFPYPDKLVEQYNNSHR